MTRTYKQQLADLLRRKEYAGWSGQITQRGYPSADRGEVVAELFSPDYSFAPDASSNRATHYLTRPNGATAYGK